MHSFIDYLAYYQSNLANQKSTLTHTQIAISNSQHIRMAIDPLAYHYQDPLLKDIRNKQDHFFY